MRRVWFELQPARSHRFCKFVASWRGSSANAQQILSAVALRYVDPTAKALDLIDCCA